MRHEIPVVNEKIVLYGTPMTSSEPPLACCDQPSRRETRREERRETILEIATRHFLDHGYAGTTMSSIAASLGGSKGTLWNYYASKELLFSDVLDRATRDFRAQLGTVLNRQEPIERALRQFCHKFVERLSSPDSVALHRLVVGESGRFPEMGRIFYERLLQRVHQLLSQFIASAMAGGDLRSDDAADAAKVLTALCLAGSHQELVTGAITALAPSEAERMAAGAVDKFLRVYR